MRSISGPTTAPIPATQRPAHAHKNRVASEIGSEAPTGTISSTDATALTSALDAIDASPTSGGGTSATARGATTASLDPSTMKDKIDGLIAGRVADGTLTGDQATTLASLFSSTGEGDLGGGGKVGGGGSPPPSPPFGGGDTTDAAPAPSDPSLAGNTSTATTTSTGDLLASFIKQLQSMQASGTGYASSGSTATRSNASALVLDFRS